MMTAYDRCLAVIQLTVTWMILWAVLNGCAAPQRPDVKVIPEHTHEEDRLCPYHTLNPPRSWDQMFCASLGGGYWQCDDTLYYVEDK
jgi:hypothetical protein